MTVLCMRQWIACASQLEAVSASRARHRYPGAHLCPTCGFWYAGHRYLFAARKISYACKEEAQIAADETNQTSDGYGLNPYQCDACGQWHTRRCSARCSARSCRCRRRSPATPTTR
jgi:hypothetical protein